MSIMLLYFEMGHAPMRATPESPIVVYPAFVAAGPNRPARQAYALTDGHSSERFGAYGKKAVAREGERLRRCFLEFVVKRIASGADPYFVFTAVKGSLGNESIVVDIGSSVDTKTADLEAIFACISPGQVIHVIRA